MERLTADAPESRSLDVAAANLEKLRALFPEIVTEGREGVAINVDVLKQLVGDRTLTDADEKYGLNWHGKRQARQLALTPSTGTLRPCKDDSVAWETTQNLFLEGDNLEVLKLLQKSYAGKVKLIYIDPPYNTGNDFVYPDDFRDNIRNYLERTGQVESGSRSSSNIEHVGGRHTDWLNMLLPRLRCAYSVLCDGGALLMSIDDNEIINAHKIMTELFGDASVEVMVWRKSGDGRDGKMKNTATFRNDHEYVLVGYRGTASFNKSVEKPEFEGTYTNPDHDHRGNWLSGSMSRSVEASNSSHANYYSVTSPNKHIQTRQWEVSREEFSRLNADGRVYWGADGANVPRIKIFIDEPRAVTPSSVLLRQGSTSGATRELDNILNIDGLGERFRPKPEALLRYFASIASSANDIILDFFAGSGTTGHAVMAQNAADGGTRRYILVQLPERLDPDKKEQASAAAFCDSVKKPRTIAEITKERLRRAGAKVRKDNPLFHGDVGFRVYKLDSTNLRVWDPDTKDVQAALFDSIEHVKPGRTEADLLTEVLLKLGLDLCVPIETRTIAGHEVHAVGGGKLIACLTPLITRASAEGLGLGMAGWLEELLPQALGKRGEVTALFRDSAFDGDVTKTNLSKILDQHGFSRVRSL